MVHGSGSEYGDRADAVHASGEANGHTDVASHREAENGDVVVGIAAHSGSVNGLNVRLRMAESGPDADSAGEAEQSASAAGVFPPQNLSLTASNAAVTLGGRRCMPCISSLHACILSESWSMKSST